MQYIITRHLRRREIAFEEGHPWMVKRLILGAKRKGGSNANFQIIREDGFSKLCIVRNLLIYVHCCMCVEEENERCPLFTPVYNPDRPVSKYMFGRVMKNL